MKYPGRQQENPAGQKFCGECGTPLTRSSGSNAPDTSYADLGAALSEALERENATSEILRVISQSPTDVKPVFAAVLASAARLCDAVDATMFRVEGEELHLVAHEGPIPAHAPGQFPLVRGTPPGRVVLDRRTVHVADLQAEPDEFPVGCAYARRLGFRTILGVPLLRGDEAIGVITIRRTEKRTFTDRQVALLQTFANQAVIAIENVRLFNETKEALEQQRASGEILSVISSSPTDVQPVFDVVVQSAVRLCGGLHSNVYLVGEGLIHLVAHHNFSPSALEHLQRRFPMPVSQGEGLARRVIREGILVHLHDAQTDPEATELTRRTARALGARTVLYVPMLRGRVGIGVIVVSRGEVKPFSDKEIALIRTFADQAVIAIENVRLFKELETRNRDLTELEQQTATSEILRVISRSPTDLGPVFDGILRSAVNLCDALYGVAYRYDGALIHVMAHHNFTSEALRALNAVYPAVPGPETATNEAIRRRAVIHVPDSGEDPSHPSGQGIARRLGYRTLISVPMLREGEAIGAITVARRERRMFSDTQIALLETFADQAVIAIENVRLFNELQARTGQLTRSVEQLTAPPDHEAKWTGSQSAGSHRPAAPRR